MPDYKQPGVYIEEQPAPRAIMGVGTSTAGFAGPTERGPSEPQLVTNVAEFSNLYGLDAPPSTYLTDAVAGFFLNGGRRCYIARVTAVDEAAQVTTADFSPALAALAELDDIQIVAAPDAARDDLRAVDELLLQHCEARRDRFAVLATARGQSDVQQITPPRASDFGAVYYPWITVTTPTAGALTRLVPAVGHVAGLYARMDQEHGVWKAPANAHLRGALAVEFELNAAQQEVLQSRNVNAIRRFPDGIRVWGARTLSSDPEWKYVNVRRYIIYLEQSLQRGTQWAVFEPNGEALWANLRRSVEDFLYEQWRSGALNAPRSEQAFFVRCDRTTMTQNDLDNGRVVLLVGVAPLRPAEFVIIRIAQQTQG